MNILAEAARMELSRKADFCRTCENVCRLGSSWLMYGLRIFMKLIKLVNGSLAISLYYLLNKNSAIDWLTSPALIISWLGNVDASSTAGLD